MFSSMSQSWIADRLNMRSAANVGQQVRRFERELNARVTCELKQLSPQNL
jgi:hypothetical protein